MKNFFSFVFTLLLVFSLSYCKKNASETNVEPPGAVELRDSIIASNLNYPWEILWGPDNHIWMTERGGRISRLDPATGTVTPVFTINEVQSIGEGGLLGMVLHPNFNSTPQVFVVYNYDDGGDYKEKVVRYNYSGGTLNNPFTVIDNIEGANVHNGSRLVITPDLKLFITTGDAADPALAQTSSSRNGKILRINLDGTVPVDNPTAGNPQWSMGHRNPQGLVFANNRLYSSEHGPNNDDEINIIEKGRNYGWVFVQGVCDLPTEQSFCSSNNIAEPIKSWTPTIATAGLDYYDHDLVPQWKKSLLLATLKNSRLYQLKIDDAGTGISQVNEYYNGKYGRMRDICISPQGKVYICTSNGGNDRLVEISRKL